MNALKTDKKESSSNLQKHLIKSDNENQEDNQRCLKILNDRLEGLEHCCGDDHKHNNVQYRLLSKLPNLAAAWKKPKMVGNANNSAGAE